jgi:hypothetical protein
VTFKLRRRQFPVRLAFALTINKAQGQSVRHVGVDLCEPVFAHGQLYVALSRATSRDRIKLLLPPASADLHRVQNIVYPEIFHMLEPGSRSVRHSLSTSQLLAQPPPSLCQLHVHPTPAAS